MEAFKYCDQKGIKILTDLTIKVTPHRKTNDKAEFYSLFKVKNPTSRYERAFKEALKNPGMYHRNILLFYSHRLTDYDKFKAFARANKRLFISKYLENCEQFEDELFLSMEKDIFSTWGISSFTDSCSNVLMWAHYSENKGLVIEFCPDSQLFSGENYIKVKYRENPFEIDPYEPFTADTIQEILAAKMMQWSYENETRLIYRLSECLHRKDDMYVHAISAKDIKSVTLGVDSDDQFISDVIRILQEDRFQHVTLWKATINRTGVYSRQKVSK